MLISVSKETPAEEVEDEYLARGRRAARQAVRWMMDIEESGIGDKVGLGLGPAARSSRGRFRFSELYKLNINRPCIHSFSPAQ